MYAVTYALAYGSGRVTGNWSEFWGSNAFPQTPDLVALAFIAMSIGMFFFARSGLVTGQRLLDLGLVYEVIGDLMYRAVRIGGIPCSGLPWRWGYGWPECD